MMPRQNKELGTQDTTNEENTDKKRTSFAGTYLAYSVTKHRQLIRSDVLIISADVSSVSNHFLNYPTLSETDCFIWLY